MPKGVRWMLRCTTKGAIQVILPLLVVVFVFAFAGRWDVTSRITNQFPWRLWESLDKVECNYGVGKWVPENNTRPMYSGLHCRWLWTMTNCREMPRRKDFSYEFFRWQPDNCVLPDFNHQVFLKRMKNKTIAFVGDSLGRQQFESMMCMATNGGQLDEEVEDVGVEYNFVKPRNFFTNGSRAFRIRTTNTTILFHWALTLCQEELISLTNKSSSSYDYVALHLDRANPFLTDTLHKIHVLVLNNMHHWAPLVRNSKWVIHINGLPVKDKNLTTPSNARVFALSRVADWLDSQLSKHPGLKVFFRTFSPSHFKNGSWYTGGTCDNTTPLAHGDRISLKNNIYDASAVFAVHGTGLKLLDVTGLSVLRDEAHVSKYGIYRYDCLHWCLPGIPDEWNNILYAQI